MENAAEFTAVPGWGGVAMGVTALGAAALAARQGTPRSWLAIWLVEVFVAVTIAASTAATKAKRANSSLFTGPGRKFALSFAPPIFVGGLLTFALFQLGAIAVLPGVWLLLYGAAIVTGGAFSVRAVPILGVCMMILGTFALVSPGTLGKLLHGGGIRCGTYCVWGLDRTEIRRLRRDVRELSMAKSSTVRQEQHLREAGPAAVRSVPSEPVSASLDRLIHERIRLGIVSALAVNRSLTFNELKALLKTTDGNLSVHARKLEEADYIVCTKSFDGRLPKTEYRLTALGRKTLEKYLDHMEALIRATRER